MLILQVNSTNAFPLVFTFEICHTCVNKAKKAWDLYDETGLKSLVKIALENFNNNILICDPVYISEPITNKKKNKT